MNLLRKLEQINNKLLPHTPDIYGGENQFYVDELIGFINNPKTNNVALMGDFGTGKSSILEQLKDELGYQKCSLCHCDFIKTVSFLSFRMSISRVELRSENEAPNMKTKASNDDDNASGCKATSKSKSTKSLIQSEFIRQLFYSVSPNKLRGSHYSRVGRTSPTLLKFIIIAVYAILLAFISNNMFQHINGYFDMLLAFIFVMLIYITVYLTIIGVADYLYSHPLKAFGVNGIEVALKDNDNDFEQLLDEIIYFFNRTKCKVLIIEDIDRFNDVEIYEDLRDLNVILNSARAGLKKKITFIYAMRPSLLPAISDRAKLFDAIIPVVPFVSSESSYSYAKQVISNTMGDFEFLSEEAIDKISHLISSLTSDARTIKLIANAMLVRAHTFCCNGNYSDLYRKNSLYVAVMAVVQEFDPIMYAELCCGTENDLDKCYEQCLIAKQRNVDKAKIDCRYKGSHQVLLNKVAEELLDKLRTAASNSNWYYFEPGQNQGKLCNAGSIAQAISEILNGKVVAFAASAYNTNGRHTYGLPEIEKMSDNGKKLVEISRNSASYYDDIYESTIKRKVWSYMDSSFVKSLDLDRSKIILVISQNNLLDDNYRMYIAPIEQGSESKELVLYKRKYLQPRMMADYAVDLCDDDVLALITNANEAGLASPAMLNYSIARYVFGNISNSACTRCAKLMINDKNGKDLQYLLDFYLSYLNNDCSDEKTVQKLAEIIKSGKLLDDLSSENVSVLSCVVFSKSLFANYPKDLAPFLVAGSVANATLMDMCKLLWLANISEDDASSNSATLVKSVPVSAASANGVGYKLAKLLKIYNIPIDDISKFNSSDIDAIVGLWRFNLTTENLQYVSSSVLTNVISAGAVDDDDMKFILMNGNRSQKGVVLVGLFNAWNANKNMLDSELTHCAVEVLRNDDAYQTLNSAFIVSLLEQYAFSDDIQTILPKYIDSLANADILKVIAKTQYRKIIEAKGKYVRIQAHDGCQTVLDRLKVMGYVDRYEDTGNGKIHVVPTKTRNEV